MQVRSDPVSSYQMRLGLANTEGLKLLKGEIVQAVVEKVIGEGLFQINIKGMTVDAATDLMLAPGQNLLLRSEGRVDGRQILRVVKPGEEYSLRVATLLQELGYKADDRFTAITAKLIQYGLPLTRENIDHVLTSTRRLGEFNSLNLEISVWVLAGGLKNNPEILMAVRSFLTKPESVKSLMQQILQSLSVSESSAGDSTKANPFLSSTNETSLTNTIPFAGRVNSTGTSNGMDILSTTERLDSNNPAYRLESAGAMSRLDRMDISNRMDGVITMDRLDSGMTEYAFHNLRLNTVEGLFKAIMTLINLRVTGDPEMMSGDLQQIMANNKEVIRALAVIQEVLTRFPDTAGQVGNEVLQLVQSAEGELLGQAAFNSAEKQASSQQPGFYYLAIPLELGGKDRVMELKIYKDDRGTRRLDELEEIRLAVSLDTANLGMVVFHVTLRKNNMLEIQGVVNNPNSKEAIERSIHLLQQRLMEHGYEMHFGGMKLTSEPEKLRPCLQTVELGLPALGIDITV